MNHVAYCAIKLLDIINLCLRYGVSNEYFKYSLNMTIFSSDITEPISSVDWIVCGRPSPSLRKQFVQCSFAFIWLINHKSIMEVISCSVLAITERTPRRYSGFLLILHSLEHKVEDMLVFRCRALHKLSEWTFF